MLKKESDRPTKLHKQISISPLDSRTIGEHTITIPKTWN